jgi:hypothetical protein
MQDFSKEVLQIFREKKKKKKKNYKSMHNELVSSKSTKSIWLQQ